MLKHAYFLFTTQQPDRNWCCSRHVRMWKINSWVKLKLLSARHEGMWGKCTYSVIIFNVCSGCCEWSASSTGSFTTEEGRVGTQVWGWMIWGRDHSLSPVRNITPVPQLYKLCSSHYTKELTRLTYKTGGQMNTNFSFFDVLLTVHLSIFISVFNQLDAQNLFHSKFYFMPLHVSSTCARNM